MVPTTLLAQVDSSVGGKVGINHPDAKNIIGAFHQPVGVWIDTETLRTLPDPRAPLRAGRGGQVRRDPRRRVLRQPGADRRTTSSSRDDRRLAARRRPRAAGSRPRWSPGTSAKRPACGPILNFGHTIGHAIEAVAGYDGPYQHGEAVAVGMVAESRLAERLGWIGADVVRPPGPAARTLRTADLRARARSRPLLEAMSRDKKNRRGKLRFVLPRSIGKVELTDEATGAGRSGRTRRPLIEPTSRRRDLAGDLATGAMLGRIRRRSTGCST